MTLANLKPKENSTSKRTRKGRGNAAGKGGECGRGHKGQKSRSGYSRRAGFEGGQNPLYLRIPKLKGFKSLSNETFDVINLDTLDKLFNDNDKVTTDSLFKKNLISGKNKVKILGRGKLTKKLFVTAAQFSKTAEESIKKLDGTVEII